MAARQKLPIQRRLIGFLLFVSLIPLAAMGCYGILIINRDMKRQEQFRIDSIIVMNVMQVKNAIYRAQDELITFSRFSDMSDVFAKGKNTFDLSFFRGREWLRSFSSSAKVDRRSKFSRLSLINKNGKEFYRMNFTASGWETATALSDYAGDHAFLEVKKYNPDIHASFHSLFRVFTATQIDKVPCIALIIPYYSTEKRFVGCMVAVLDDRYIMDSLLLYQRNTQTRQIQEELFLVNQCGDIIYEASHRESGEPIRGKMHKNIAEIMPQEVIPQLLSSNIAPVHDKKPGLRLPRFIRKIIYHNNRQEAEWEEHIYLHDLIIPQNPIPRPLARQGNTSVKNDVLFIIEKVPLGKLYEAINYYMHLLQGLLASFTILSIVTGVYLSRNFLNPIKKIIKGTEEIAKGNWDYSLSITTGDEFEELANHFNSMMGQLKTLYNSIEQKVVERTRDLESANKLLADTRDIVAQEKKQLESVLNATREGIIMVDPGGYLVFANRSFNEMFQFSLPDHLEEKKWNIKELVSRQELFQEAAKYESELQELLKKPDEIQSGQIVSILPRLLIINWFSAPVRVENENAIGRIIAFRDVTREKEVERMKDEFVSIVSHELRTPMTSLGGSLSLVLDGTVGEINEDQRELLEIAKNNTTRLIRLINDILDISKIESGKIKMKNEQVDIRGVVHDSVEGIKGFAHDHAVSVDSVIEEGLPVLTADKDRLIQVVTNLLSNAIKFSPAEGTVHVKTWKEEDKVYLSVRDEGAGIPPEYHEKIFEKFQQVDSSSVRQKGGTGLGLPICRAIVGELKGKLWVESEEGKGSTFFLFLPIQKPAAEEGHA